ncbi:MAG: alpha/beta fold hydrolase [Balneolales bacterium]
MSRFLLLIVVLILMILVWLFLPVSDPPEITSPVEIPVIPFSVKEAADSIRQAEIRSGPLKPDNHARIVWNPEYAHQKAPCSIVYLHGYSASYGEGAPAHIRIARDLGCHLYIARLHAHGLRTNEPLQDFYADSLLTSSGYALAIGELLGEHVIVTGTSMGGTLALHLASRFPDKIDALVLLSPLIGFASKTSMLFDTSWGQRIMRLFLGGRFIFNQPENDDHARYWYGRYHIKSLMTLSHLKNELLSDDMYSRIQQPVFTGYYYKDEKHQDQVVSVSAILKIKEKLGTPDDKIQFMAFPDAGAHVISSAYRSPAHEQVYEAVTRFLKKQLVSEIPGSSNRVGR